MYLIEIINDHRAHVKINGSREEFERDLKHFKETVPWNNRYWDDEKGYWVLDDPKDYRGQISGLDGALKRFKKQTRMF